MPAGAPAGGPWRGVLEPSRAELRERGSRFLAELQPAADAAQAERLARALAAALPDATHHVRAHRLVGADGGVAELAHDAGEPAGTAGRPVLDALAGANLIGAVLVVSRWFGGVKLGKGGLARAYGTAARAAVAAGRIVPLAAWVRLDVSAPFADVGGVTAAARVAAARIVGVVAAEEYRVELRAPEERVGELERALANLTAGRARVVRGPRVLEADAAWIAPS
jgi:putative IMPACT (imprinted ancient) family translation regulator